MQAFVLGLMLFAVVGTPVLGYAQSTTRGTKPGKVETRGLKVQPKAGKVAPRVTRVEPQGARVEDVTVTGEGNAVKDSWLTTKTAMKLFTNNRVKAGRISVDTHAGVVTLRGKVETPAERAVAESVARSISGVRSVNSAIQIVPLGQRKAVEARDNDLVEMGKARLAGDAQLREADVKLRADYGLLTLMGTVPDRRAKARAAELVRIIPGVKVVRNELKPRN
jgi:osmotically-inducible protein OsmY